MYKKRSFFYLIFSVIMLGIIFSSNLSLVSAKEEVSVSYSTHVQTYGWLNTVKNGTLSGTTGENKRVEAIKINLENAPYSGGISYKTHVQNYGWLNAASNGAISGKTGESKRVEAIQINLTGEMNNHYDIYYRVHSQTYGWLDWAKNGQSAGTEGLTKQVEAIQIVLIEKGKPAPGTTSQPFISGPSVTYSTHVQTYGWLSAVKDGTLSGTTGENKRVEAIKISLENSPYSGGISYKTHVQNYGWLNASSNGTVSGKTGESKRVEAIQINLTGEMSNYYDIYYRVHSQSYGWLGWAKNGQSAGTTGLSKQVEAIELKLVKKGQPAPGSTTQPFVTDLSVNYSTHVQNYGWLKTVKNGALSGTTGESKRVEAIKISLGNIPYSGGITYKTHVQNYGWLNAVSNGAISGKTGEKKRVEAIQINLTGEISNYYDVYYRVHSQTFGWLGWAKNGMKAGSEGQSKQIEAIEIKLVIKGQGENVSETNAFKQKTYITNSYYNITLNEALNMQMKVSPQTDKYRNSPAYINKNYVETSVSGSIIGSSVNLRTSPQLNDTNIHSKVDYGTSFIILDNNISGDASAGDTRWFQIQYQGQILYVHSKLAKVDARIGKVTADTLNVRADTNAASHIYGILKNGAQITILGEKGDWYQVNYQAWRNATSADVLDYLNPSKFINDDVQKFQFMDLTKSSDLSVDVLNQYLKGKGILDGQGQAFLDAGKKHGVNEVYLMAHALLETGNGSSTLANGVKSNGKTVYNMYGIGAYDNCAVDCGTLAAYNYGWFTPYDAIVGGAAFINDGYLNGNNNGNFVQNTLYKMRWNPEHLTKNKYAGHQYASDIGWAYKQVRIMAEVYKLNPYTVHLDIPVYK